MFYQYWIYYFLFIKKIYKTRHRRTNQAANNLGVACISFLLLFMFICLEILFGFKGFLYLTGQDIPLAPIGLFAGLLIFIPISLYLSRIRIKDKYQIFRKAIIKTSNINIVTPLVYIIICCSVFIIGLIIIAIHSLK